MINSSPITTWEGAGAFFNFAGSGSAVVCFWIMTALLVVPLIVALNAERSAEQTHG